MQLSTNKLKNDVFYLLLATGLFCFLFIRCRYGFPSSDESFYLTIPLRLTHGDALLVHEWHLSMLSSVPLYPLMIIYTRLNPSLEGIILHFRYAYVVVQTLCCAFVYFRLKKINSLGAMFAALCFQLYTLSGISALSYNTMGVQMLVLSTTILVSAEQKQTLQYIIAGILLAGAVLCCPYLVLLYIYFTIYCFSCFCIFHQKSALRMWLGLSIGAAASAGAFAVFMLLRTSIHEILESLPYIFQDPEHKIRSFGFHVICSLRDILYAKGTRTQVILYLCLLCFVVALDDRKRRFSIPIISVAMACAVAYGYVTRSVTINFLFFPANMAAVFGLPLSNDKRINELFWKMWIPGAIYAFCIHCSSNQHLGVMFSAFTVSFVGSILMLSLLAADILSRPEISRQFKTAFCAILTCACLLQLGCETYWHYRMVFGPSLIEEQTQIAVVGPAQGIYGLPETVQRYNKTCKNIQELSCYQEADSVFSPSLPTWFYLAGNHKIGAYSAWLTESTSNNIRRLKAFYEMNPDKMPDLVISNENKSSYISELFQNYQFYERIDKILVYMK